MLRNPPLEWPGSTKVVVFGQLYDFGLERRKSLKSEGKLNPCESFTLLSPRP